MNYNKKLKILKNFSIILFMTLLFLCILNVKSKATDSDFRLFKDEFRVETGKTGYVSFKNSKYSFKDCIYYIEDTSIAEFELETSSYLTIKGIKNGDTILHIEKGNEVINCRIHIYTKPQTISIEKEDYKVYLGSKVKVNYSITPFNSNCEIDFCDANDGSLDNAYTISKDGVINPLKEGSYCILLKIEDGYAYKSIFLEIMHPKYNEDNIVLYKNTSKKPVLNGENENTKFTSSNPSIVTVDKKGNLKAVNTGNAKITADTNGYKAYINVSVKNPSISNDEISMYPGKSKQLSIIGGTGITSWKSDNSSIIDVTSDGKIIAKNVGTTYIYATVSGITLKCKVVVKSPYISNKISKMAVGQTYKLKLNGYTGKIKWKSSNSKVIKVASSGKITGKKTGTATITATANGKKIKLKIKVKKNQITYKVDKDATSYRYGNPVCQLSKVYYSGKNLIADVWVINARSLYAAKFKYINLTITDENNKVIAKKKFKNIPIKLHAFDSKKITFKFTGNSVKNKKAVLINGVDFDYSYVYKYEYRD